MAAAPALEIKNITKKFTAVQAVADLSFEVRAGEIFGLLGPNGAGKTTTIRMALDIIKPDRGQIAVLGGPMDEAKKDRIGYLPEERGLYDDMTLQDTLVFLARLKDLTRQTAVDRVEEYLKEVELWEAHDQKIETLSRGMNQKAQFVAATLHEADLIIVDEPFSGLDPINTRIIKQLLYRMQARGAAIIMSTHQMNQVEEMCERILLIDHGREVLYGSLREIRARFAGNAVEVDLRGELEALSGVENITLPMMVPIYLWTAIVDNPNGPVALALSVIPFSAPVAMLMRMTSSAVPAWQLGASLALVLLNGVGMLWLMGRLFRVQTLLSGESISLQRFIAALRG